MPLLAPSGCRDTSSEQTCQAKLVDGRRAVVGFDSADSSRSWGRQRVNTGGTATGQVRELPSPKVRARLTGSDVRFA